VSVGVNVALGNFVAVAVREGVAVGVRVEVGGIGVTVFVGEAVGVFVTIGVIVATVEPGFVPFKYSSKLVYPSASGSELPNDNLYISSHASGIPS